MVLLVADNNCRGVVVNFKYAELGWKHRRCQPRAERILNTFRAGQTCIKKYNSSFMLHVELVSFGCENLVVLT